MTDENKKLLTKENLDLFSSRDEWKRTATEAKARFEEMLREYERSGWRNIKRLKAENKRLRRDFNAKHDCP